MSQFYEGSPAQLFMMFEITNTAFEECCKLFEVIDQLKSTNKSRFSWFFYCPPSKYLILSMLMDKPTK
jgi:hypothetical protein